MPTESDRPQEGWAEALTNISPLAVVFMPFIAIRLGLARLDGFTHVLIWGGSFVLVLFYLPYKLHCWGREPDKRPGFFRFCAEASRKDWLVFFCLITISFVFVSTSTVAGGPKDLGPASVRENDALLWTPAAYIATPPTRGDIVVYNASNGTHYLRRIVGLPGETIAIDGGRVTVNDLPLDESYIRLANPETAASTVKTRITLGTDEYIILSDDRSDPQSQILVKRRDILGKVFLRYLPLRDFGLLPEVTRPSTNP